jgi:hypothetical protein
MQSALGFAIDRVDAEKRQPEIREALQQTVKFRLVLNETLKHSVPMVVPQVHALEQASDLVAQLALGLEPVRSHFHHRTLAQAGLLLCHGRDDHLGDCDYSEEIH